MFSGNHLLFQEYSEMASFGYLYETSLIMYVCLTICLHVSTWQPLHEFWSNFVCACMHVHTDYATPN
jgi:hypothetical protein